MLKLLQPTQNYPSIEVIAVSDLLYKNIKCLFIDVDNTLVSPFDRKLSNQKADWINQVIESNIKIVFLSNNTTKNIKPLIEQFNCDGHGSALKPFSFYYRHYQKKYQLKPAAIGVIGDQLFTDILGGKLRGYTSIYVTPLTKKDLWFTRFARKIEKRILASGKK